MRRPVLAALVAAACCADPVAALAQEKMQVGFLWHMHQPIYYPGQNINQTQAAGHFSFSLHDVHNQRFGPYTSWPRNAIVNGSFLPNLGAQVSFSGSLIENLNHMRDAGVNGGMWNNWNASYTDARNRRTALNNSRLDLIGFTYHHGLGPLLDERDLRMQIRMHRIATQGTFGSATPYSKGFFPAETAFSTRMIPALVAEGFEWAIVDNIHFDRATKNYPHTNASGLFAPNRADQVNPDPGNWIQLNGLWAPSKVSAPFSYRPAHTQYVNPATGQVQKIIAVPGARYEGNEDGRGGFGALQYQQVMDQYRQFNTDPGRPMYVMLHHDGDNYGGGSDSYYNHNWNQMLNWANGNPNYNITTVADYLQRFPVPQNALIHVEPGSWAGADNGDPEFKKWLGDPGANGWSPDRNSWAVLTAAKNRVYTAEDLTAPANPQNVINNTGTAAERAWHYLTQAQASDHWYWDGTEVWDSNVTRGANLAVAQANTVLTPQALANETTPPSVFLPQREIYNPGAFEFGTQPEPADFDIWTYAYDVSGISSISLKYRRDLDGENPLASIQNETYAGGPEVGNWITVPMSLTLEGPRPANILAPTVRADKYVARIIGERNVLLDYYVEAFDLRGNLTRTDIQHVYVGQGSVAPDFAMDGQLDSQTLVAAQNGSMKLNWALRNNKLYLSTNNASAGNDHFVFVSLSPDGMNSAPWAKSGQVAKWNLFLAAEHDNSFSGWFNNSGSLMNGLASARGSVLEGFFDLVNQFGELPEEIYLAVGAFETPDGGRLRPNLQVPASFNNDFNLDPIEYIRIPIGDYPQWSVDASGAWSASSNWTFGAVPNAPGARATLAQAITNVRTLQLDVPVTLGRLRLNSTNSYLIQGSNALTMQSTVSARIELKAGSHTIEAPVRLASNTTIDTAPGTQLFVTNLDVTSPGISLIKSGAGTATVNRVRTETLRIAQGELRILPAGTDAAVSRISTLEMPPAAGTRSNTPAGRFDLTNNALVIDYSAASPMDTIRALIVAGYSGGSWTGPGIASSATTELSFSGIGYAEAWQLFGNDGGVFMGQPVDATTILVRFTLLGDANLDGEVNGIDFNLMASSFAQGSGTWATGDFNYDGTVNGLDFNLLAANFGRSLPPGPEPQRPSSIPEPASAGTLVALIAAGLAMRKRRIS